MARKRVGFAEAARARTEANRPGGRCGVLLMLDGLDEPLRSEVVEAIKDRSISANAIVAELRALGIDCPRQSLERHRRVDCRCPDDLR